jgi:hypothetical protein
MSNRLQEVMNGLELAAKKLEISIEDAVDILLGKHPTHCVTPKPLPKVNVEAWESDTAEGAAETNSTPSASAPSAVSSEVGNPTSTSTTVGASVAAENQSAAGSTVSGGDDEGEEHGSNN